MGLGCQQGVQIPVTVYSQQVGVAKVRVGPGSLDPCRAASPHPQSNQEQHTRYYFELTRGGGSTGAQILTNHGRAIMTFRWVALSGAGDNCPNLKVVLLCALLRPQSLGSFH
jgi:hypothetical protein